MMYPTQQRFSVSKSEIPAFPPRNFKKNQRLENSATFLWRIHSGIVKTYSMHEDGSFVTLGYWGKGDVVGGSLYANTHCEMVCVTPVLAQRISLSKDTDVVSALINHIWVTQTLLQIRGLKLVKQRLQHVLLWLADKFGVSIEEERCIDFPLTHVEMAELIGTTRVTITRSLKELTDHGYLKRDQGIYTLTELALRTNDWFESI